MTQLKKEMEFIMDSEVVDWLKAQWKKAPSLYKVYGKEGGNPLYVGFTEEVECRLYDAVKTALEDTRLVKKEDK